MNGPDHYTAAEEYLDAAEDAVSEQRADQLIATAQVHATLALAAATALGRDGQNWHKAAGI
ncbi:hypothetical protein [Saccharopolyspora cebuensis]|uniref:hypothetical protein n=1 Tax=Saccharopolyspora cebuensis TaxID=418759 RepID=UPI0031E74165